MHFLLSHASAIFTGADIQKAAAGFVLEAHRVLKKGGKALVFLTAPKPRVPGYGEFQNSFLENLSLLKGQGLLDYSAHSVEDVYALKNANFKKNFPIESTNLLFAPMKGHYSKGVFSLLGLVRSKKRVLFARPSAHDCSVAFVITKK